MNKGLRANLIRVVFLLLAQVLIFKHITFSMGGIAYVHFIIYPLAILMLPVGVPKPIVLLTAFVAGIVVDMFYDSPGVHTAAIVFTGYLRSLILAFLEPYEGYKPDDVPSIYNFGFGWFVSYISLAMLAHIFAYFSLEAFSLVYFFEIFLNSIFSFFVSFLVIMTIHLIFRSKY
jgi:hypothetical protein